MSVNIGGGGNNSLQEAVAGAGTGAAEGYLNLISFGLHDRLRSNSQYCDLSGFHPSFSYGYDAGRVGVQLAVMTYAVAQSGGTVGPGMLRFESTAATRIPTVYDLSSIGTAGSPGVRVLSGSTLQQANRMFNDYAWAGRAVNTGFPGPFVVLPDGTTMGIRTFSTRSPGTLATIQVWPANAPRFIIKYNP